jgi:hypothetical protein
MANSKTKAVFLLLTVVVGLISTTTIAVFVPPQVSAQNLTISGSNMTSADNMTDTANMTGSVSKMLKDRDR